MFLLIAQIEAVQFKLGSNPREDHGELLEGRREEEDRAPPGNPATTVTTTPEPHRDHGERGYGVEAEATETKRKVTKKEQRVQSRSRRSRNKASGYRERGNSPVLRTSLTRRATASRPGGGSAEVERPRLGRSRCADSMDSPFDGECDYR